VSIATVSRVINEPEKVSIKTRQKVQLAIEELRFHPNRVARRLSKLKMKDRSGNIIGLVLPDISNPFYVDVLKGVQDFSIENDYAVIFCDFGQDESREKLYLDILKSELIDGLIVAPIDKNDSKVIQLIRSELPIVCIDRELSGT